MSNQRRGHRTVTPRDWRRIYSLMVVGESRFAGRGLFAGCDIASGSKVGEFEGDPISIREARLRAAGREVVAIVELDRHALDATDSPRGFRFINHSCDPNLRMRCQPERAEFYSLRDIAAGDELTVDYGLSHHDGKLACKCGAVNCRRVL